MYLFLVNSTHIYISIYLNLQGLIRIHASARQDSCKLDLQHVMAFYNKALTAKRKKMSAGFVSFRSGFETTPVYFQYQYRASGGGSSSTKENLPNNQALIGSTLHLPSNNTVSPAVFGSAFSAPFQRPKATTGKRPDGHASVKKLKSDKGVKACEEPVIESAILTHLDANTDRE